MFVNIDVGELSFILAARLYENGKLSLGQAVENKNYLLL